MYIWNSFPTDAIKSNDRLILKQTCQESNNRQLISPAENASYKKKLLAIFHGNIYALSLINGGSGAILISGFVHYSSILLHFF